jgi:endonuclease III
MPTATLKQRVLNRILTALKRDLPAPEPATLPVIEHLLYAICREGTTRARADEAFQTLQKHYFDWNEVRVSSARDVAEALAMLPNAELRASRIISILQELFETTFSFDLETLHKKGLKQAEKQLQRFDACNGFVVAYTLQMGLGAHSLPVDADMRRTLVRLEMIEEGTPEETLQASLEHLVPKANGQAFGEAVSVLAQEYCHAKQPACPKCPVHDVCPTGQKHQKPTRTASKTPVKAKAR